ncbi:MAG: hypothetical protein AAFV54_16740 [Pseudomonadota bacterium]
MAREKSDIRALLDRFSEALAEGDFALASEWCDLPCTIVRPTGTILFQTAQEAAEDLEAIWSTYRERGVCGLRYKILDQRSYVEGLALVDVEWELLDTHGHVPVTFNSTYGIRQAGDTLKVTLIMAHNEVFQRPYGSESQPGCEA